MIGQTESSTMDMLQKGIATRQEELQRVADILARAAYRSRDSAGWVRALLIFLGGVTATQGGWEKVLQLDKYSTLLFSFVGLLVSTVTGVEAYFKLEKRGAALNMLAASCHSTVRKTDAAWYKLVGIASSQEQQIAGAMSLIELLDAKLSEILEKAAEGGINIALEVRGLCAGDRLLGPEEIAEPAKRPYLA